jgi:hypothetical protein
LLVLWNGSRVGLLVDQWSQLSFRYEEAWLAAADACALSRQLPLRSEGWPMVRGRIHDLCRRVLDAIRDDARLPELRNERVREIVTQRAERMLRLTDKAGG